MRSIGVTAPAVLALLAASQVAGQTLSSDPFENLPLAVEPAAHDPDSAQLAFKLLDEIPLPGPLPGPGPRLVEDAIEIPVAGGTARIPLSLEGEPRIADPETAAGSGPTTGPATPVWVENEPGKLRFGADGAGWLRAERRCRRCERGWKKEWKLRVPGLAGAPPLVVGKNVCFGALDNRVTCVRAGNGHRRWTVDVGGRVLQPLVYWPGPEPAPDERRRRPKRHPPGAVLAVIERGAQLAVIAADDGLRLGGVSFDTGRGKLVSFPLATQDGRIVVARQGYAETDASLLVYSLQPAPKPATPAEGAATPAPAAAGS